MTEFAKEVVPVNLEDEMRQSYLDYAMSVIVGRALPDARDGLKPVHRRVLFSMLELGNDFNKPYKKSARVVGDVIGKYHPHGDTAVYDTIVRMAQPFSMRYTLVDGQGNFGSVDGDSPAAMRYTEIRLTKLSHELMADLEKDTVDFEPNYDESEFQPRVLPTRIPNLLINGSTGIAVGMATNIPPHNLTEVVNTCLAYLDNPEIDIAGMMEHISGPDFPTAGIINGAKGIKEAYETGRGKILMRSVSHVEGESDAKQSLVITEIPYQVNKARLIEKIAELVKLKKIEGITELRDESDKDGMRIAIDLRRGENPDVLLNNLYKQTQLQTVFGINMVAIIHGQPKCLNLQEIISHFIGHRREVVTRRTLFLLRKARDRAHILEGLAVALSNIDPVIKLIRESKNPAEAKALLIDTPWDAGMISTLIEQTGAGSSRPEGLEEQYGLKGGQYNLSPTQAQAILDLRLHRLTGLEQDKIVKEYEELLEKIAAFLEILNNPDRLREVIREELVEVIGKYGDERKTKILIDQSNLTVEDLITEEDVVVTLSHAGYCKAQPLSDYSAQRRGGRGKSATKMKDEDFIERLFVASTHDTLLFFTSAGKVYWRKVWELPLASRGSRGRPLINLIPMEKEERVNAILSIREFDDDHFIFMATRNGVVKKTPLTQFSRPRVSGIIALDIKEGDQLVDVALTDGQQEVMLFSSGGKAVRFTEDNVRAMGRTAGGVRGIKLKDEQKVVGLVILSEEGTILTITENGYGKRTKVDEFRKTSRGTQGVTSIKTSERNGNVVGAAQVVDGDEIMMISNNGTLVRTEVEQISIISRNTQGVRLMRMIEGEILVEVERIANLDSDDGEDEETFKLEAD